MNISTSFWMWTMAACVLAMWSFVIKENPVYRVAEHVFVGSSAGHAIGMAIGNIHRFGWRPLFENGQFSMIIPLILGLLLYARFFPNIKWLVRWPIAFLVGVGVGQSIYTTIRTQVINQTIGAIAKFPQATTGATINALISTLGVLCVLTYFLFTIRQTKMVKAVAQGGRWMMMVTFGVSFGNVVAGRISVLLGEITKVFGQWLGML